MTVKALSKDFKAKRNVKVDHTMLEILGERAAASYSADTQLVCVSKFGV